MLSDRAPAKHKSRLRLGVIVATGGAIDLMVRGRMDPAKLLHRHRHHDWGDLSSDDAAANDAAVAHEGDEARQGRVLSCYTSAGGERLWIITESDRSATTLLLPEEY
jgi:hypothetical protein